MWTVPLRTWLTAMWLLGLVAVLSTLWTVVPTVALIAITAICLAPPTIVLYLVRRPEETVSESIRGAVTRGRE